jgi:ABC-2 type transport system permease protein
MTVFIGIPPLVVYGIKSSSGLMFYIYLAITTLFLPLIPISIGAVFAYAMGRISTKFRSTNAILIIGTFLIIIAFMFGSTMIGQVKTEQVQNAIPTVNKLSTILFWSKPYISALKDGNMPALLLFILASVIPFVAFILVLSKGFKSINSKMSEKYKRANYRMQSLKVSSPLKALYFKELRFYFSSYIYVVNTGFGMVMMTIFSIALIIFGQETVSKVLEIKNGPQMLYPLLTVVLIFCVSFTFSTAPSISLEGKNLWIAKSLPVKITNILWSKILVNMTLTIPLLIINIATLTVFLKIPAVTSIAILGITLSFCIFSPLIGILINLYLPKFDWNTQMVAVKQSASVLVATLFGFISIAISCAAYALVMPPNYSAFLGIAIAVMAVINLLLVRMLHTVGVKKFRSL